MLYYYFTIAFVMLASWAVAGVSVAYSPEHVIKKHVTVKNKRLLAVLKIKNTKSAEAPDAQADDAYHNEVSVLGIVMKAIWLLGVLAVIIILFAVEPSEITDAHKTTLIMPAELTTINQKIAHYLNLTVLSLFVSMCVMNSIRVLSTADGEKKKELTLKIIWCAVSVVFFAMCIFLLIKCIPLFALL